MQAIIITVDDEELEALLERASRRGVSLEKHVADALGLKGCRVVVEHVDSRVEDAVRKLIVSAVKLAEQNLVLVNRLDECWERVKSLEKELEKCRESLESRLLEKLEELIDAEN